MNSKYCLLTSAVILGVVAAGCNSEPAKSDAEVKKAFLGGPPPKGYMNNTGAGAPQGAQEAAAKAAAKAAAENAGK